MTRKSQMREPRGFFAVGVATAGGILLWHRHVQLARVAEAVSS